MPPRSMCSSPRILGAFSGFLLLASGAIAQSVDRSSLQVCETPTFGGTYHAATGTFTPAVPGQESALVTQGIIYDNTCPTNYFSTLINGGTIIDDGRIPTANSPIPATGTLNNYRVNKFQFAFCTRDLPGVVTVQIRFFADHDDCQTLASAGTPAGDITLTGLPGSAATGTISCWLIDVDLTGGAEFCMQGDANGVWDDGTDLLDGAGFGFTISGQTGTSSGTSGGWYLAGLPSLCVPGDNTYYQNPGIGTGTGLDNSDLFRREGTPPQTSGCFFFGGPPAYAGWHMKIEADVDDCTTCPGNPNADGDSAPDCVDGCPNDPNKIAPGQCGCGVADTDTDGDTFADCIDNCDLLPNDQADCNLDGIGDACAILGGAPDCNLNGIPDSCDIANLTSADVNGNGVPDECDQAGGTGFCYGSSGCPCGNNASPSGYSGCLNSTGLGGRLVGSGNASVTTDTLVLTGSQLTGLIGVIFQGNGVNSLVFGDGKRCFAGGVIRIGTAALAGGTGSYPPGGPPISVQGSVPGGGGQSRYYQMIYRNGAGPCGTGLNITNGVAVVWGP